MGSARLLLRLLGLAGAILVMALGPSCGGAGFEPVSKVDTVRILASRATPSNYAKPGDTVMVEVLAFDARPQQPAPMKVWWLPFTCINPPEDLYYLCFTQLAGDGGAGEGGMGGGADGGGGGGLAGMLGPGVDLTPFLVEGSIYPVTLPPDIITTHKTGMGQDPYGLAIAFNIACAGHVELLPTDPGNRSVQQVPVGCFDADHNQLGPDAYVIGFTRVYAYNDRTNANPVIDHVTLNSATVDPTVGVVASRCTTQKSGDCPTVPLDVTVPPSSQEPNPSDIDENGNMRKEQIWVDYFATVGDLADDARLLYDPTNGQITDTATKYAPPQALGDGVMWAVVHDNRGGTDWQQWSVHVQ
jgi:hypothetical protein